MLRRAKLKDVPEVRYLSPIFPDFVIVYDDIKAIASLSGDTQTPHVTLFFPSEAHLPSQSGEK